jgi:hypothetical protein
MLRCVNLTRLTMALHVRHGLLLAWLVLVTSGCFPFVYHARQGVGPDYSEVAIDWNDPHSSIRWGTFWGVGDTWEPIACSYADGSTHTVNGKADKQCTHYFALCEHGVGRVQAQPLFYSIPLAVVTIGILFPVEMTGYCSTDSMPSGPSGPVGPSGPAGPTASSEPSHP